MLYDKLSHPFFKYKKYTIMFRNIRIHQAIMYQHLANKIATLQSQEKVECLNQMFSQKGIAQSQNIACLTNLLAL